MGGGIRTYIHEKRAYLLEHTPHQHLLIVPGERDETLVDGRVTTVTIRSPHVPGSTAYRLLLRNRAVRAALEAHRPDVIESLDAYNLPWAALRHRREHPSTAVIGGYRTDFPRAYVGGIGGPWLDRVLPSPLAAALTRRCVGLADRYVRRVYSQMDRVYALSTGRADALKELGVPDVQVLPLGVDLNVFSPARRDPDLRTRWGASPLAYPDGPPVLIYAGRLDAEKQPDLLLDAFERLPASLGAILVLMGDGPARPEIDTRALSLQAQGRTIHVTGYVRDRAELARHLASADLYVSAMAHETFGISILEAQACGLPVVGVRSGAMPDRVSASLGRLAAPNDAEAFAAAIQDVLHGNLADMGRRARQHVEASFGWDRTFRRVLSFYADALASRPASVAP
ncbi:MAG: glycosyltransferase family 1 protein [Rubricoccaceae bacterium]